MAYTMMTCLPCEVVAKIVDRGSELKLKERLKKGWGLIHDEMMWRETHEYSCIHHSCWYSGAMKKADECGCYRRYPGFLLRRVDSGAWLPGAGETRAVPAGAAHSESEGEWEGQANAVWFDFEANEMGLLGSMTPTNFINDIQYN